MNSAQSGHGGNRQPKICMKLHRFVTRLHWVDVDPSDLRRRSRRLHWRHEGHRVFDDEENVGIFGLWTGAVQRMRRRKIQAVHAVGVHYRQSEQFSEPNQFRH